MYRAGMSLSLRGVLGYGTCLGVVDRAAWAVGAAASRCRRRAMDCTPATPIHIIMCMRSARAEAMPYLSTPALHVARTCSVIYAINDPRADESCGLIHITWDNVGWYCEVYFPCDLGE